MAYFIGVDGGGSRLRIVIVDEDLQVIAQSQSSTVNPSIIGRNRSADLIRAAIRDVVQGASVDPGKIHGVGIGVAGAASDHDASWLQDVVEGAVPQAECVPSSDMEIALVGAHGVRQGVLVLAGTGSVAMAVNASGESARAGGWGYLIGDEGSGYFLGRRALSAVMQAHDGQGSATLLSEHILARLRLTSPEQIITWLYQAEIPRVRDVAQLAPLVLETAAAGDDVAVGIIVSAVDALELLCRTVVHRLDMCNPSIAFAGGLLEQDTAVSKRLCERLGLAQRPVPLYSPVIGAAILAKLTVG